MQPTGFIACAPVFVVPCIVTASDRGGGIAQELAVKVRKAERTCEPGDVGIFLTPEQFAALKAERAELKAQHAQQVTKAEAKGLPAPEPLPEPLFCEVDEPAQAPAYAPTADDDLTALAAELAALPAE